MIKQYSNWGFIVNDVNYSLTENSQIKGFKYQLLKCYSNRFERQNKGFKTVKAYKEYIKGLEA